MLLSTETRISTDFNKSHYPTFESQRKRQKLNYPSHHKVNEASTTESSINMNQKQNSTHVHNLQQGTFTPITQTNSFETLSSFKQPQLKTDIEMLTEDHFKNNQKSVELMSSMMDIQDERMSDKNENQYCPCGYLHPRGIHEDIHAVGLSEHPLLRGPE